jgi:Uma2 family endonuclease
MSAAVKLEPAPAYLPLTIPQPLYRLTLDQYHRLIETGVLREGAPVELIEGLLVQKMTRHPPHDQSLSRINRRLARLLSEAWELRIQCAITLRRSEPEPDVAIARGPEGRYSRRHPGPRDIVLLIEVAESSLHEDRTTKATIYADARIPEYWIINVIDSQIEVYTDPRGRPNPAYRHRRDYGPDDEIPLVLDGKGIARLPVRELLPMPPSGDSE